MAKLLTKRPNRRHEMQLWADGYQIVAGVDEVGRGSLAGPVTAAAVILPATVKLRGVRDSKVLTRTKRLQLVQDIKRRAMAIGVGWASPAEVDQFGLTWAVRQSGLRALAGLTFDAVLLDGNHNYLASDHHAVAIIKADSCCLSVAAASIVAKEARDAYMQAMHRLYPEFGFDSNVGYGTRAHRRQLTAGVSPIHRRRYLPVKLALAGGN